LSLPGLEEHGPILVKHIGVGPSSHPFLKGRYLNLWRLWRWWRARWLKSLGIVHQFHRVPHLFVCPSRPLLLNLDVMLAPAHPKNEVEELPQRRGRPAWPVGLPTTPPVRPPSSKISPSCPGACSTLGDGNRGFLLGLSFKGFCVTFLGNSVFATFSIIYRI
jgi:hypothetical protein